MKQLKLWILKYLPNRLISIVVGKLFNISIKPIKNIIIKWYMWHYDIDLSENIQKSIDDYPTFNDFFIRQLDFQYRPPISESSDIISPADAIISQMGVVTEGKVFTMKDYPYDFQTLISDKIDVAPYERGVFFSFYLSPRDYHRFHMPATAYLKRVIFSPGELYSIEPNFQSAYSALVARNKSIILEFTLNNGRSFIMVCIGALIVGQIIIHPIENKSFPKKLTEYTYETPIRLEKGEELGYFVTGSSIFLCFEPEALKPVIFTEGTGIQIRQTIGSLN